MNEQNKNTTSHNYDEYDTCIFCGRLVPEGTMVCPICEQENRDIVQIAPQENKKKKISFIKKIFSKK